MRGRINALKLYQYNRKKKKMPSRQTVLCGWGCRLRGLDIKWWVWFGHHRMAVHIRGHLELKKEKDIKTERKKVYKKKEYTLKNGCFRPILPSSSSSSSSSPSSSSSSSSSASLQNICRYLELTWHMTYHFDQFFPDKDNESKKYQFGALWGQWGVKKFKNCTKKS